MCPGGDVVKGTTNLPLISGCASVLTLLEMWFRWREVNFKEEDGQIVHFDVGNDEVYRRHTLNLGT